MLELVVSLGVKITAALEVKVGIVPGEMKAKLPATEAVPPVRLEEESACPEVIALAFGQAVTDGVVLIGAGCTSGAGAGGGGGTRADVVVVVVVVVGAGAGGVTDAGAWYAPISHGPLEGRVTPFLSIQR